jgi:hypothetical protein
MIPGARMRVCFRARFAGPKGALNPFGWKFGPEAAPQSVEVYRHGARWHAREPKHREVFRQLEPGLTHGTMKDNVVAAFERQCSEWEMYDAEGYLLNPAMIEEDPKGNFTMRLETHIAAPDQIGQPGNSFKTACGIVVAAQRIRSKRGSVPPDCKACKAVWQQTKPEERIA